MTYAEGVRAAQDAAVESYVGAMIADKDRQIADRDATLESLREEYTQLTEQVSVLESTVADLRQQLSDCQAQQPQPAAASFLIGGLLRGTGSGDSAQLARPVWDIVRTYNNGDMLDVFNKGKGRRVATSYGKMLGGPGWRNNATIVAQLKSQLAAIPDVPDNWVADTHEFDNPQKYGTNVAEYLADAAVFKQCVAQVNVGRKNPLKIFRCCMAYSISQPDRNIDAFYEQDPQNYDAYGPDVYSYKQIDQVLAKAERYGKDLVIPEMGPLNAVPQVDTATSGGSILDYMQTAIAKWDASPRRRWACWFDFKGAGADLDQYPKSLAYWSGLVKG